MAERPGRLPPLAYDRRRLGGRLVLAHDPTGPGRIVEAFGDPDAASRVAVLVPGNAQSLVDYARASGHAAVRRAALTLHASLTEAAPDESCAVIAWLGYRCPRGLIAAARPDAAEAGAADLRRLTHWLPASTRVVLVGHSYGSLVAAMAAEGGRVDDLVAVASPGLGVRHVSQLRTSARVWALRGASDWVRWLPRGQLGAYGHGRQPADRGFGARVLDVGPVHGHSGYYAPGSTSLAVIAAVVLGRVGGPAGRADDLVGEGPDRQPARVGTTVASTPAPRSASSTVTTNTRPEARSTRIAGPDRMTTAVAPGTIRSPQPP